MRHELKGQNDMTEARLRINEKHYQEQGMITEDLEDLESKKAMLEKPRTDLTQLFPELKNRDECVIQPTVRRVKSDEKQIC